MEDKEVFDREVARELMLEIDENVSDEDVSRIWEMCDGNPWNAGILYRMVRMREKS